MKDSHDSWEVAQISKRGVWKKLILALTGDLEGLKPSMEKVTADVVELAKETSESWICNWIAIISWYDFNKWGIAFLDEQRKWFLDMNFTPGKNDVRSLEKTTKNLEYCINLFDKAVEGFESIESNFERCM